MGKFEPAERIHCNSFFKKKLSVRLSHRFKFQLME